MKKREPSRAVWALFPDPLEYVDQKADRKCEEVQAARLKALDVIGADTLRGILGGYYLLTAAENPLSSPKCKRPDFQTDLKIIKAHLDSLKNKNVIGDKHKKQIERILLNSIDNSLSVIAWRIYDEGRQRDRSGRPRRSSLECLVVWLVNAFKNKKGNGRIPWKDIEPILRIIEPTVTSAESIKVKYYNFKNKILPGYSKSLQRKIRFLVDT